MERYMRAYRDPKSPLTPLTPLGELTAFAFNIDDTAKNLTPTPTNTPCTSAKENISRAKRYSKDFQKLLSIFEQERKPCMTNKQQQQQSQQNQPYAQKRTSNNKNIILRAPRLNLPPSTKESCENNNSCCFRQASPVAAKSLSPRINTLLEQAGVSKLKGLFQREEIDSAVLSLMKPEDLKYLGIEDKEDIRRVSGLIKDAWKLIGSLQQQK